MASSGAYSHGHRGPDAGKHAQARSLFVRFLRNMADTSFRHFSQRSSTGEVYLEAAADRIELVKATQMRWIVRFRTTVTVAVPAGGPLIASVEQSVPGVVKAYSTSV